MAESVVVRVPASSANLGPGFDSFAAALALHLEVEVVKTGKFAVVTELAIATDRKNLLVRGFERVTAPDEYEFRIKSEIPLSGGLGSSASAVIGGLLAAREFVTNLRDPVEAAAAIEGHPDNAAAALHGGFVICVGDRVVKLKPPENLAAVLVVPHAAVRTKEARAALKKKVPLQDAVFNLSQASSLAIGIERGDLSLIAQSLGDALHQPRRAGLYPQAAELMAGARDFGALGATISGAGPTVLVWCESGSEQDVAKRLQSEADGWADVIETAFEPAGAKVS
jgi:homoserine kinase